MFARVWRGVGLLLLHLGFLFCVFYSLDNHFGGSVLVGFRFCSSPALLRSPLRDG
jgi:hypothetical protein